MKVYIEYQGVCPFVGIGAPHPLSRKLVWLPPRTQVGGLRGETLACEGEGVGVVS